MVEQPHYDLRQVRARLAQALDEVDRLIEQVRNPAQPPDLSDYEALVRWNGRLYRQVGSTTYPGGSGISVRLQPAADATQEAQRG